MATKDRSTSQRTIGIPLGRWDRIGTAARAAGTDRTTLINAFLAWYLREPRAKLPKRPPE